jgi:hypothetical protein
MLRVTVELISAVDPANNRVLGIATIANDGSGTMATGNYDITLSKWAPKLRSRWKSGRVEGSNRLHLGPWDLLYLGLRGIVGDRCDKAPRKKRETGR